MQDVEWQSMGGESALKIRIKFRKYGAVKFIGHLDTMRYFQKAMRRADIPIAFSGGYSPHMIMSFAYPLGVGVTSDGEYFDIEITELISSKEAVQRLNEQMVEGFEILSFKELPDTAKNGMSIVYAADYLLSCERFSEREQLETQLKLFWEQEVIEVSKKTKKSERVIDIKPFIYELGMKNGAIFMQTATGSVDNVKPFLVMKAFMEFTKRDEEELPLSYHRLEVYAQGEGGSLVTLESFGSECVKCES